MSSPPDRRIERIARKFHADEEPSLVDEYAHLSNVERAHLFLSLRKSVTTERYGTDRGLERICTVVRRP